MTLLSVRKTFIGAAAALAIGGVSLASAFNGANLLSNGTFDSGVSGWGQHADFPAASVEYFKGTAKVTNLSNVNTATHGAAVQCVNSVEKAATYALSYNAYIPSGQGRDGGAQTRIFWYDGANCTGPVLGSPQGPKLTKQDTWLSSEASFTVPAGAASAEIFIISSKDTPKAGQFAAAPFVVNFDNVKFGKPVVIQPPTNTPVAQQPTQAPQQSTQVPQQPTQAPQQPTQVPQPPTQPPTQTPDGGQGSDPSTPTSPAGESSGTGPGAGQDQSSGTTSGGGQPGGPSGQPGGATAGTSSGGTASSAGMTPDQPQVSDSNPPTGQGADVTVGESTGQDAPLPPNTGSGSAEDGDPGLMLVLIALVAGVGAGAATVGAVKSRRQ
jgi:hypothetical protein